MTALSLLAVMVIGFATIAGAAWAFNAFYKDGYRDGYHDGQFDAEFPEFQIGPMIPLDRRERSP